MTVQNIIERVQNIFPNVGETEVLKEIDLIQKKFSEETCILEKEGELASPSTALDWDLPSDFVELISIDCYDSSGNPQYLGELEITYVIDTDIISFYSTSSTTISNMSGVDSIYMRYAYRAGTIDAYDDTFEVPSDYHEGIEAGVMERFYARYPTIEYSNQNGTAKVHDTRMIGYYADIYKQNRIKAKQKRNSKERSIGSLQTYPFAGRFELIKRGQRTTPTTILPVTLGYDNYLKITLTSPSTVTIGTSWGWSTTPTGVISGGVLTLTSADSEFTETMVIQSNYAMRHNRASATTWNFILPSSWSTINIYLTEPS